MEDAKVKYGNRIKYIQDGNLKTSYKIFSNGHIMARVVINVETKHFQLIDPVTGFVHYNCDKKLNNMEVVQRNVKRELIKLLDIEFEKEIRKDESVSE